MGKTIHVDDIHTPAQIDIELAYCLGLIQPMLYLGSFASLLHIGSPYLGDGPVSSQARKAAMEFVSNPHKLAGEKFDSQLRTELAAAFRALEIIQGDKADANRSQIPPFGPEWLTDLMGAIADAMPSLTPAAILHEVPLVLALHLVGASHRRNGGITRRPSNDEAAFRILRERAASHQKQPG